MNRTRVVRDVLMAVGIVFAIIGGWFLVIALYQNQDFSSPAVRIGDVSQWKTWTNQEYGLEVKYPSNWFVIKHDVLSVTFSNVAKFSIPKDFSGGPNPNEVSFTINVLRGSFQGFSSIEQWLDEVNKHQPFTQKIIPGQITVGGVHAIKTATGIGPNDYYLAKDGNVIDIEYSNQKRYSAIIDQMLSTFQFVSPTMAACDVLRTDFGNRSLVADQFGTLQFKNGVYDQYGFLDDEGNSILTTYGGPEWKFEMDTSTTVYPFGDDTIVGFHVFADHLSGSGSFDIFFGYKCSGGIIKKVLEQTSISRVIVFPPDNKNILGLEWSEGYNGAGAPEKEVTKMLQWSHEKDQFEIYNGNSSGILPQRN